MPACINCTTPVVGNSEFCSRQCSESYWTMDIEKVIQENRAKEKTMAKKTEVLVTLVDDITGEEFTESDGETMLFAFDGEKYELDVNKKNAEAFRRAVKKYVEAARVVTGRRVTQDGPSEASQVRAWAAENGREVNAKGRIPADLMEAYKASQASK